MNQTELNKYRAALEAKQAELSVGLRNREDIAIEKTPDALDEVHAPTLFIVGGDDFGVIDLNEHAMARLRGPKSLQIVPHASHLFPEPGALEAVIDHAARWLRQYLAPSSSHRGASRERA